MTKISANAKKEDTAPKEIIQTASETVDRVVLPQIGDMAAFSRQICQFMSQRLDACAEAMAELERCQTLAEIWSIQIKLGQETFKAYSNGATKFATLALSTSSEGMERLRHVA